MSIAPEKFKRPFFFDRLTASAYRPPGIAPTEPDDGMRVLSNSDIRKVEAP